MQLDWLTKCGLLEPQPDTGVIVPYPLEVKRAIIDEVVGYFHRDYAKACEGITHLSHLKWTLEVIGAAFRLPLPSCEGVIVKAVKLYRIWIFDAARRPRIVEENCVLVSEQIFRHVSQLFEQRVAPATRANQDLHHSICHSALELFVSPQLGSATDATHKTMVRILLGMCDFTLSSSLGLAELSYVLVSALYGALLAASFLDDRLWEVCFKFAAKWGGGAQGATAPIRQWAAVLKGLTIALQPSLIAGSLEKFDKEKVAVQVSWAAMPRNFRKATDVEMPTTHAFATWRRFLELLGNLNRFKDPRVHHLAACGVRDVLILCSYGGWWAKQKIGRAVPLPSPSADSLYSLLEPQLLESVFSDNSNLLDGRAQVVHALCAVICRPHPTPPRKLRDLYACIQHATTQAIAGGDGMNYRAVLLQAARFMLAYQLPGAECLMPAFLRLAHEVTPIASDARESFCRLDDDDDSGTDDEYDTSHLVGLRSDAITLLRGMLGRVVRMGEAMTRRAKLSTPYSTVSGTTPTARKPPGTSAFPEAAAVGEDGGMHVAHVWLRVSLQMLTSERDVKNRSMVIQTLGVWLLAQVMRANADEVDALLAAEAPTEATGSEAMSSPAAAFTSTSLHDILALPEGLELTLGAAVFVAREALAVLRGKHSLRVGGASLAALQHCVIPLIANLGSWPPERHPARGLLRKVDPSLPKDTLRALVAFLTNLYNTHLVSHIRPGAIYQALKRGLQVLNDLLYANPEVLTDDGATALLTEALDNLLLLPPDTGVPPAALAVFFSAMRAPNIETQYVSKAVHEDNYIGAKPAHTRTEADTHADGRRTRYFVLDGTRVMTLITHPPSERDRAAPQHPPFSTSRRGRLTSHSPTDEQDTARQLHSGGVTIIIRDAFGRHVWDAKMDLGASQDGAAVTPVMNAHSRPPLPDADVTPHKPLSAARNRTVSSKSEMALGLLDELLSPLVYTREKQHSAIDPSPLLSGRILESPDMGELRMMSLSSGADAPGLPASQTTPPRRHNSSHITSIGSPNEVCDQSMRSVRTMASVLGCGGGIRFPSFAETDQDQQHVAQPLQFRKPGEEGPVDQARLLLAQLQLAPNNARVAELAEPKEVMETLRMVDNTPPRELHNVSVVYFHDDRGEAALQDLGLEWYISDPGADADDEAIPATLPTLNKFLTFIEGVGWPLDPAQRPDCYIGGGGGDRWRRQRVHYFADPLHEMLFLTSSLTPSAMNAAAEKGPSEDPSLPTVRIIWNDTKRDFNPSALHASQNQQVIKELSEHLPSWAARKSRTLDLIVQPLDHNLVSIRVILPLANERWLGLLAPSAFNPTDWHAPVLDGMVVPLEALPHLLRRACLTASQAFKTVWQPMFDEMKKKKVPGVDFTQRRPFPTYMSPIVTRAALLSRLCQSARVIDSSAFTASQKVEEGARVYVKNAFSSQGVRVGRGEKGTVRKAVNGKFEVLIDRGVAVEAAVADLAPSPIPVNFSWTAWRESRVSAAAVTCSLFSVPQAESSAAPTGRSRARGTDIVKV
eukprot:TRINITY_DN27151_c0_g1_i1.p1 TRINITY_DN27151_c0_g1~~TRINITY_DN27151_c0_g1_i1.p1  ORF type:complete len:1524 (+),score=383.53 TRINITY_DN27151_c0_g1_i1:119-4690(+)